MFFNHVLKVVSAILGRNINDHIHLIFSPDPLATRPVASGSRSTGCLQRCVFLMSCLWGGQLADQEERSEEWIIYVSV